MPEGPFSRALAGRATCRPRPDHQRERQRRIWFLTPWSGGGTAVVSAQRGIGIEQFPTRLRSDRRRQEEGEASAAAAFVGCTGRGVAPVNAVGSMSEDQLKAGVQNILGEPAGLKDCFFPRLTTRLVSVAAGAALHCFQRPSHKANPGPKHMGKNWRPGSRLFRVRLRCSSSGTISRFTSLSRRR